MPHKKNSSREHRLVKVNWLNQIAHGETNIDLDEAIENYEGMVRRGEDFVDPLTEIGRAHV